MTNYIPSDFSPEIPNFPSVNPFLPCYGKFDLTTYIQGASDYEIMANLVQLYNTMSDGYNKVQKLSTDTVTAFNELQELVNTAISDNATAAGISDKLDKWIAGGTFSALLGKAIGWVTPEMFGAVGNGITDDTESIVKAFNSGAGTICFSSKKYKVQPNIITVPSNTTINGNNATLIIDTNALLDYNILFINNASNISITGLNLYGDQTTHEGENTQGGHGIRLLNSSNITLNNCNIDNCNGDGIIFATTIKENFSTNIKVHNCAFHNNGRNDISVIGAKNVTISNCIFNGGQKNDPKSAIDLEAEYSNLANSYIVISNCIHSGSDNGFSLTGYLDHCIINGCITSSNIFNNWDINETGLQKIEKLIISNNYAPLLYIFSLSNPVINGNQFGNAYLSNCDNYIFSNNSTSPANVPNGLQIRHSNGTVSGNYLGAAKTNCVIVQNELKYNDATKYANIFYNNTINNENCYGINMGTNSFTANNSYTYTNNTEVYESDALARTGKRSANIFFKDYINGFVHAGDLIVDPIESTVYIANQDGCINSQYIEQNTSYAKGYVGGYSGNAYICTNDGTTDTSSPTFGTDTNVTYTWGTCSFKYISNTVQLKQV